MRRLAFLCLVFIAGSAIAGEPESVAFVGVTAGVTTEAELRRNEQWGQGQPLKIAPGPQIQNQLEYRFGIWKKVLVSVTAEHIVRTIDVTPPDHARADELVKVLKLGELVPVESRKALPADALVGPPVPEQWQVFRCSETAGVLVFTVETDQKQYAKLMRFYADISEEAERHYGRGCAYLGQGEHDEAILEFDEAIRRNPAYKEAYVNRGIAHKEKRQYDLALADYNKAIQLKPDDAVDYNNRGNVHTELLAYSRAIEDYNTAIRLRPGYVEAYHNRGRVAFYRQQYDTALADFEKAIRLDPKYANAYLGRGYVHFRQGRFDEARADRDRAIQLDPRLARITYK